MLVRHGTGARNAPRSSSCRRRDDEAAGALGLAGEIPGVEGNPADGHVALLKLGHREDRPAERGSQRRVLQLPADALHPVGDDAPVIEGQPQASVQDVADPDPAGVGSGHRVQEPRHDHLVGHEHHAAPGDHAPGLRTTTFTPNG